MQLQCFFLVFNAYDIFNNYFSSKNKSYVTVFYKYRHSQLLQMIEVTLEHN